MKKKSFRLSDAVPNSGRDVDDELAFHLDMRTREFVEQGLSPEDARQRALESFGDVQAIRGDLRHERAVRNDERERRDWWLALRGDAAFALRSLRRNRGFAFAAIVTLALGIGANSAIFSIVNSVLLRPLPFPNADRLVVIHGRYPEFGRTTTSLPDFRDWQAGVTSFENVAARHQAVFNYIGGDEPIQLRADRVTSNFFHTLGVQPMLGRGFRAEEGVGGDDNVVVLSYGFWQRAFGGDPRVVGRTIRLSGNEHTVIGVAPAKFRFWRDVDLWAPVFIDVPNANRRSEYLLVFGRLKTGVSVDQGRTEVATITRRLAEQYPQTNRNFQSEVITLHDQTVEKVRRPLFVFLAAVAVVLLIACANVANLLLARASAREREIAVRSALGASRSRLLRQLLTESTIVAVCGGVVGLVLATWAIGALRGTETSLVPRLGEIRIDFTVMLFSLGLSIVTGLLFGLVPAIRLASSKIHATIKEGSRGATSGNVARFRNALVLAEVALAVVLLVGAGLLIRSFEKLNRTDPGFDPNGIITYQVVFPSSKYPAASLTTLYERILEETRQLPGVQQVALSGDLPMLGAGYVTFAVEGRTPDVRDNAAPEDVQPFNVSADYARVLGLGLKAGRFIEARDVDGAGGVAVINTEFARRFIPAGRDPIGLRVTFGNPADTAAVWWTIVGIVDVVAQEGLDAKPYPQIYRPIMQSPRRGIFVSARTKGEPLTIVPALREALKRVDSELPLNDVRTMHDRVAANIAAPRVSVWVLTLFAALAMVLAGIGIYGVLSYAVAQRTREIGIRMALGANAGAVRRLIVRQGMTPAILGLAIGLIGALNVTYLMEKLLYGVQSRDPLTFAAVAAFLLAVAFLASYVPARRATRVAPTEALRYD